MLDFSEIKFGILLAGKTNSHKEREIIDEIVKHQSLNRYYGWGAGMQAVAEACSASVLANIKSENVTIKWVSERDDILIGTHFLAEYTDVDCIIIIMERHDVADVITEKLFDMQQVWNMPIVTCAQFDEHIVERAALLVQMQSEMAEEAGISERRTQPVGENIN